MKRFEQKVKRRMGTLLPRSSREIEDEKSNRGNRAPPAALRPQRLTGRRLLRLVQKTHVSNVIRVASS